MKLVHAVSSLAFAVVSAVGVIWMIRRRQYAATHLSSAVKKSPFGREIRDAEFCFEDDLCPLNNGSFGGVPRKLLNEQHRMMQLRERNPSLWYRRHYTPQYFPPEVGKYTLYQEAINAVANFVGAESQNIVIVENATDASNSILRSLQLKRGDKILVTSETYGAVNMLVKEICEETGADVVSVDIRLPLASEEDLLNLFSDCLKNHDNVKFAIVDHITSPSAILMPVRRLVELLHDHEVQVIVDGAHAPGQVTLNLQELGADYYFGNLHKWLFAPRGCAFLFVHPDHHDVIKPAIISHYHYAATPGERFKFTGTRDYIPLAMAPSAIKFHNDLGGVEEITRHNSKLLDRAAVMLASALCTEQLPVPVSMRAPYMRLVRVPDRERYPVSEHGCNRLQADIYGLGGVFVAVTIVNSALWIRMSAHVYNYEKEYLKLRTTVMAVLA